jgi:16S rRNA (adenine1518-N6/adenine1519-N6)-dimethyltransferase
MTFRPNTDIGQNFLIDKSVVTWMMERAHLKPSDRVLEIGPGAGILTKGILEAGCSRLDAIEIDTRLREYLEPIAVDPRLALHWGDAVRFDYGTLGAAPTHIIANLPYHITTPLLWKLLETYSERETSRMLLMTQAEAAIRLSCGGGVRESNPLSITIAAIGTASVVRRVSRSAFRPAPRVDSAIVEIVFGNDDRARRKLPRDTVWRRLLSGSFATRRKTLANNWNASFRVPKEQGAEILSEHSLGKMSRPEELSVDDWLGLRTDIYLSENM